MHFDDLLTFKSSEEIENYINGFTEFKQIYLHSTKNNRTMLGMQRSFYEKRCKQIARLIQDLLPEINIVEVEYYEDENCYTPLFRDDANLRCAI